MKKLSIEEKAKRYDKAIQRARNIINSINVGLIGKDSFEAVFPELKESESNDERIRKELIFYFQEEIPQCSIQEHADKMKKFIAWLEKQGENNMGISEA